MSSKTVNSQVCLESFEGFIAELPFQFRRTKAENEYQYVYKTPYPQLPLELRVHSTIDPQSNQPRENTSIKLTIYHEKTDTEIKTTSNTYRTENWESKLKDRILSQFYLTSVFRTCPVCGHLNLIDTDNHPTLAKRMENAHCKHLQ
jgi:hypothetical protein